MNDFNLSFENSEMGYSTTSGLKMPFKMRQIDNLDAFASGKELAQINDTQNRNTCDPLTAVELRLEEGGGQTQGKTNSRNTA